MVIPSMILKQLYTNGSLKNTPEGVQFSIKNRLSDATLTGVTSLKFNGQKVSRRAIRIDLGKTAS